ncbi:MAG: M23 family metallopeptidase [Candidatus Cloacimonadaceae bacterium]|nr:M23 family metallopeptidase [Candidatus Cloacimonadaceae bacterium]
MQDHGKHILLGLIVVLLLTFSLMSIIAPGKAKTHRQTDFEKAPPDPWITEIIPAGGSIFSVLEKNEVPPWNIALVSYRFGEYIDVTTIQPGDTLKILLSETDNKIQKMVFIQEETTRHLFSVQNDSLFYILESLPVEIRTRIINGNLSGTLDSSLLAEGLNPMQKQQINNGLEAKINFRRDAREGDTYKLLVEERIFKGKSMKGGKILFASYSGTRTGTHELFRFEDDSEKSVLTGLYDSDGKSNIISGVGFPLSSIHVVSQFGRRIDPVYGRWAQHQGVDYRARYGTPIFSVANGTVIEARYNGGWGNHVRIKHSSGMISQYAHLSSMSVKSGQTVKRGQIIGRVGSTGKSTGPHLHFGLMKGNSFVNPNQLKMVGAEKLNAAQMAEFTRQKETIRQKIRNLEAPQLPA